MRKLFVMLLSVLLFSVVTFASSNEYTDTGPPGIETVYADQVVSLDAFDLAETLQPAQLYEVQNYTILQSPETGTIEVTGMSSSISNSVLYDVANMDNLNVRLYENPQCISRSGGTLHHDGKLTDLTMLPINTATEITTCPDKQCQKCHTDNNRQNMVNVGIDMVRIRSESSLSNNLL